MKLLMLNPNTSASVTERIAGAARAAASAGTEIVPATATVGPPYIATRAEAVLGAMAVMETLGAIEFDYDAVVVAAFGDPGLGGARELLAVPVVGLSEAAMLTSCMLGARFSIVSFSATLGPWYRECVAYHGLEARLAAIRFADGPFADVGSVQDEMRERLVEVCRRTVAEDDADVVILAGAPLAGLAGSIAADVPVPVIDGVAAAVRQAETLAALGPRKATAGSFRRPAPKPLSGVSAAVKRLYGDDTVA
jgi:Asp/Glu/hydantoin racemase